jgi:hypothetical protein
VTGTIRWGRIFLGGLAIELVMFAIVVPLQLGGFEQIAYYSVPLLATATAFGAAIWVCRPLQSRFVLHGVLPAVAASLMYTALTMVPGSPPIPWLYVISHGLRIAGGAAGGWYAERQARTTTSDAAL